MQEGNKASVQRRYGAWIRPPGFCGADELLQLGVNREISQTPFGCLCDAEVDYLWNGHAIVQRDEDVRGLEVAMNDAFLMRVLHGVANLDHEFETFAQRKLVLIAVIGDANATHQFHHEVRASAIGGSSVEHLRDVRMIHHRQGLALGFEARDHLTAVHAGLDHLEGYTASDGFFLFRDVNGTPTAFANLFAQLVPVNRVPGLLSHRLHHDSRFGTRRRFWSIFRGHIFQLTRRNG